MTIKSVIPRGSTRGWHHTNHHIPSGQQKGVIQKLGAYSDVNEHVLIPKLEIPRNTTTSVNTSAIFDDSILDDKNSVLQPTPSFIAKSIQKIKDFGNWLFDYIPPKPKVVDEALVSFKNLIKKCTSRETPPSN